VRSLLEVSSVRAFGYGLWLWCVCVLAWPVAGQAQSGITLDDIWQYFQFYPEAAEDFQWMKDDTYYSELTPEGLVRVSVAKPSDRKVLLGAEAFKNPVTGETLKPTGYAWSADEKRVLLFTQKQRIYRRSSTAIVYVADLATQKLTVLNEAQPVSEATFSPDGQKVGFVFGNNLYVTDLASGKATQLTTDGKANEIINGTTDWVYEEEFEFVDGFRFSPDSRRVAYYRFDERKVPEFTMDLYGGRLYPKRYTFKYPKAGEKNAIVDIYIHDLGTGQRVKADLGTNTDQYIPRIRWTRSPDRLAVVRMNRHQSELDLLFVEAATGAARVVLNEKSKEYLEISDQTFTFLEKSDRFVVLSERSGFRQAYLYDYSGKMLNPITSGPNELTKLSAIDETRGVLYYESTEDKPYDRYVYAVGLDGKNTRRITERAGWNEATFSSACNYYVHTYSNPLVPPVYTLCQAGKYNKVRDLVTNDALATRLAGLKLSKPEFFSFETAQKTTLHGWMIKPANFDRAKKYPVLMHCYGGPGHQEVKNEYNGLDFFWYQHLADQGYMIVCVDGRGTGARGTAFRNATYLDLGKLEAEDQIETARYLGRQPYVDRSRIGIWGWSFGGYLSTLALAKGNDVFRAAIAVAPVTNWRYYDTIYTERFLRTPAENPQGYDQNSPLTFAKDIKGRYLLVHGMADDNVHFQNAVEMADALIKNRIPFEQAFYPNNNHGIFGPGARIHLYAKMTDFLLKNL
jgi:dipeptidyl-peptidase-4